MSVKVVIYCHSRLFSEGLQKILKDEPGFEITGTFSGSADQADVTAMDSDVILSDLDTFHFCSGDLSRSPGKKILLLYNTAKNNSLHKRLPELVSNGIVGLLPGDTDTEHLIKAINTVSLGDLWINRGAVKEMLSGEPIKGTNLTRQEMKIGGYICRGFRNKEIAKELDISEQTVKSHCNKIYRKLGISDRLQLALWMITEGIAS